MTLLRSASASSDSSEGGIKTLVKAERAARRGERQSSDRHLDRAKEVLRGLPALAELTDL